MVIEMTVSGERCPICGQGHLVEATEFNMVEYGGRTTSLPMLYSVCDVCGSDQSDAAQTRANKRAMIAFRKQVDGLLTGAEVRALRERLGLNQAQAAQIFGGGPVAFSKYENDDVAQSDAMDKLLRVAADMPETFARLAAMAGVEIPHAPDQADEWRSADWDMDIKPLRPHRLRVVRTEILPGPQRRYGT